jgi:putative ATPase
MVVEQALSEVKKGRVRNVPNHLKDTNLDSKRLGQGAGYKYPHDYEEYYMEQEYWTHPIKFYVPSMEGCEREIRERLLRIRKKKNKM